MVNMVLENWCAWAPGLISEADWQAWSQCAVAPKESAKITSTKIAPMLRRRCSHLTKMAIEVADSAMIGSIDYAVFCSQHGDVDCSLHLLKDIARQQDLSPMKFVQSVHNASAGLLSIMHQLQHNMTSIAAGEDTFAMGMLEAWIWLSAHDNSRVLLVMFDEHIPADYASLNVASDYQYALALSLSNKCASGEAITMSMGGASSAPRGDLPQALAFLSWFLRGDQRLEYGSSLRDLVWERAHVV